MARLPGILYSNLFVPRSFVPQESLTLALSPALTRNSNTNSYSNVNVRAVKFKCSVDQAKRSFYRAANSIFARVGRLASEEVMVQLPFLIYALEVCNLDNRILQSLDFTVNRFFMKLFRTSNTEIVHYRQTVWL